MEPREARDADPGSSTRRRGRRWYLLLWLLVPLPCVVAFVLVTTTPGPGRGSRCASAASQLRAVAQAVLLYMSDHGRCPSSPAELVAGRYVDRATDAWDRPLRLRCRGVHDPAGAPDGVDVWSVGRDGRDDGGEGDDLPSWRSRDEICDRWQRSRENRPTWRLLPRLLRLSRPGVALLRR